MAENSKIEWTDHTFNPWEGCTKVSPGCANCYAEARNRRFGLDNWGKGKARRRTSAANWKQPLKWDREAQWPLRCNACGGVAAASEIGQRCDCGDNSRGEVVGRFEGHRPRVFCASLADWLDDEVPIEWLADLLKLIHDTPNLDWLLLTKRPENWAKRIDEVCRLLACDGSYRVTAEARAYHELLCPWRTGQAPHNVWIGTTVENQDQADKRIPELLKIPARVRFLSCEPLLGPVEVARAYPDEFAVCSRRDCGHWGMAGVIRECVECESREENPDNGDCANCGKGTMRDICPKCECSSESECYEHPSVFDERLPGIHWIICGGESGPNARPMHPDWARSLRDQCQAAGVPFFFKQWGEWMPDGQVPLKADAYQWESGNHTIEAYSIRRDGAQLFRVGKKAAGRLLDGREWSEFPQ